MKPKKMKQMQRRHWRLEYKNFIKSMGELALPVTYFKYFKHEPAKVKLKTRLILAWAILKAPRLARKGKLVDYLNQRWTGKGLKEQDWTEYEKVIGLIRFKCRTKRDKPGGIVQIMVNETWWAEPKALKLLPKEYLKIYNEAEVTG